jgi:hypothetical protein
VSEPTSPLNNDLSAGASTLGATATQVFARNGSAATASGGSATVGHAPARPSDAFEAELRALLRSRLIIVHILFLAFTLLLMLLSLVAQAPTEDSSLRPDFGSLWRLAISLGESVIGTIVLWRNRRLSLRALRLWELLVFGFHALYAGLSRYEMLAYLEKGAPNPPPVLIAFNGAVSLNGFVSLILAYGVLIPNTRRRSLTGVAALGVVPIVAGLAAIFANPALQGVHFAPIMVQNVLMLCFPSAIAVFAASRANALQRRAFDAERRSQQIGQYSLKRKLGEGGMGEVFLAEHQLLKRPCAVKLIRPEMSSHPAMAARFDKEVQAVTGLTHFNTVRVYDYGRAEDGSFYYVMEYLDGPTLENLVGSHGPLPPGRAVHLLRQLCGALGEAHAAGLVHRDLKPSNVIIAKLGGMFDVAKLLDFGLVLDESTLNLPDRLSQTGVVLGTPSYMAPEQAAGEQVDSRGDIYGLGALAFFALAGHPPFVGTSALRIMAAHRSVPAPPLRNAPPDLANVVARCLAKEPRDRFQTTAELERDLSRCDCASEWPPEQAGAWWSSYESEVLTKLPSP